MITGFRVIVVLKTGFCFSFICGISSSNMIGIDSLKVSTPKPFTVVRSLEVFVEVLIVGFGVVKKLIAGIFVIDSSVVVCNCDIFFRRFVTVSLEVSMSAVLKIGCSLGGFVGVLINGFRVVKKLITGIGVILVVCDGDVFFKTFEMVTPGASTLNAGRSLGEFAGVLINGFRVVMKLIAGISNIDCPVVCDGEVFFNKFRMASLGASISATFNFGRSLDEFVEVLVNGFRVVMKLIAGICSIDSPVVCDDETWVAGSTMGTFNIGRSLDGFVEVLTNGFRVVTMLMIGRCVINSAVAVCDVGVFIKTFEMTSL